MPVIRRNAVLETKFWKKGLKADMSNADLKNIII